MSNNKGRGYDEETEEFIGNVEELSGEIANLTKTASTPGGISLFTDDSKTEINSFVFFQSSSNCFIFSWIISTCVSLEQNNSLSTRLLAVSIALSSSFLYSS